MDDATYDLGAEELGKKRGRPGLPVEPRRILRILAPHRRSLLRAFLVAAAVSLLASLFVPETYESESVLLYEGTPLPRKQGERISTDPRAFVQSAVVPSSLRDVRDRLGWDISLDALAAQVHAAQEGKDALILAARAGTAEDAQLLAQTLLEVFLAHQATFNEQKLARLIIENDRARERAEERRDAAQEAFNAFTEKSGKPDLLDEKAQLLERAADLQTKSDEAAVEIAAQRALVTELAQARRELPARIMASAKEGSAIEVPLARARAELAEARATLSEEHPRVQALKQRVASLQGQKGGHPVEVGEKTLSANPARADVVRQLATARGALAAAEERQSALQVLLTDVERALDELTPEEGEARQVIGELDAAIARFDELTARGATLRDASLRPLTGFRVLSTPDLPEESARATPLVALLVFFPFLVLFIYAAVLIYRGLRALKVEAPREVAWWGNGPVLGTSNWPRDPDALDAFVDELEDQAVYGAGRTLVVPASEKERDIACSFAMRLAEAPWLAAAILDVGDRGPDPSPIVTPAPGGDASPIVTPAPAPRRRRLSSQGIPSVAHGRAIPHKPTMQGFVPPTTSSSAPPAAESTPAKPEPSRPSSSRPPRKKTAIGLPALDPVEPIQIRAEPIVDGPSPPKRPTSKSVPSSGGLQPFQRKRRARATVRMIVPVRSDVRSGDAAPSSASTGAPEDAVLLTRPVPVGREKTPLRGADPSIHLGEEPPRSSASNAVMRAAVRLLGDEDDDVTQVRPSAPPSRPVSPTHEDVRGVALAWNGPLTGPVLRRAARLAHRVVVVVASGLSVVDLAKVKTRLGREKGVGYVLVNVDETYIETHDRVGPVEEFWQGEREGFADNPRLP